MKMLLLLILIFTPLSTWLQDPDLFCKRFCKLYPTTYEWLGFPNLQKGAFKMDRLIPSKNLQIRFHFASILSERALGQIKLKQLGKSWFRSRENVPSKGKMTKNDLYPFACTSLKDEEYGGVGQQHVTATQHCYGKNREDAVTLRLFVLGAVVQPRIRKGQR